MWCALAMLVLLLSFLCLMRQSKCGMSFSPWWALTMRGGSGDSDGVVTVMWWWEEECVCICLWLQVGPGPSEFEWT